MKTIKIDSSLLLKGACNLRIKRKVIDGYNEKLPYNDTQYGSAFHEFVRELYVSNGDYSKALLEAFKIMDKPCQMRPRKEHLSKEHLTKTCTDYWINSQKGDSFKVFTIDNQPVVEVYFEIPFYTTCDYAFDLVGTIDSFGEIENGIPCVRDFKTHSLYSVSKNGTKSLEYEIEQYLNKFELSLQLRFYVMCLKIMADMQPELELSKKCKGPIGAFIDGVFLSGVKSTEFRRSKVWIIDDEDTTELYTLLKERLDNLVRYLNSTEELRQGIITGSCVDGTFPCEFLPACMTKDSNIKRVFLDNTFTKKPYEPKEFGQ